MAIDELKTTDEQTTTAAGVNGHSAPAPTPATVPTAEAMAARIRARAKEYPYDEWSMQTAELRANWAAQRLAEQVMLFLNYQDVWRTDGGARVEKVWEMHDRIARDPVYRTYMDAKGDWEMLRDGRRTLLDLLVDEETLAREREQEQEWEEEGGREWINDTESEGFVPAWTPRRYRRGPVLPGSIQVTR